MDKMSFTINTSLWTFNEIKHKKIKENVLYLLCGLKPSNGWHNEQMGETGLWNRWMGLSGLTVRKSKGSKTELLNDVVLSAHCPL